MWKKILLVLVIIPLGIFLITTALYPVPTGPPYHGIMTEIGGKILPTEYINQCPLYIQIGRNNFFLFLILEIFLIGLYSPLKKPVWDREHKKLH